MPTSDAVLALEDGTTFRGRSFGATGTVDGEVVFNTSMTGYPEILTDPSYCGQMVCMTYPLIGNYGITPDDFESRGLFLSGFIVRECSRRVSSWRSRGGLADLLAAHGVVGIEGIDTRRLVRHIRQAGAMKAVLSTEVLDGPPLAAMAADSPGLVGRDLVQEVTCEDGYEWDEPMPGEAPAEASFRVVAYDYGIKYNILRLLVSHGCRVEVVPAYTGADEVLSRDPDGVFLSNGPGDPAALPGIVEQARTLVQHKPVFGICLGHQVLGQALGGTTYKLKFGHHGGNQPVKDLGTGRVEITCQNHGFAVDVDSLPEADVERTHVNLNDGTLEGMRHRTLPVFSVQYHPESGPGPHDARYLFDRFVTLMRAAGA